MEKNEVKIGEAAEILGVSIQTLRNWDKSGKFPSKRSLGRHRYYDREDLKRFKMDIVKLGLLWSTSEQVLDVSEEYYCERQDRFTSRLEKMSIVFGNTFGADHKDIVSLLTLVAGEIGDNAFVHNIGSWPDIQGVFFAYDINKGVIVIADRGQGVRKTISRVRAGLENDMDALRVAFTEIISGRAPEKRGNGLKVVRRIAQMNSIGLTFRSGIGLVSIPKSPGEMKINISEGNVRGTYAVITF